MTPSHAPKPVARTSFRLVSSDTESTVGVISMPWEGASICNSSDFLVSRSAERLSVFRALYYFVHVRGPFNRLGFSLWSFEPLGHTKGCLGLIVV